MSDNSSNATFTTFHFLLDDSSRVKTTFTCNHDDWALAGDRTRAKSCPDM